MENENYQGPPLGSYEGGMLNEEMFNSLWNSKFYKLNDVATLSAALLKIDYSVVASRRDGHNLVVDFVTKGVPAANVFNDNQRFVRRNRGDVYISDTDTNFYGLIIGLTSVLSFRETTSAKDTKAANAAVTQLAERVAVGNDQGFQDNAKKFEELQKQLRVVARVGEHTWDRARFESKVAFWVVPAPQMDP